MTRARTIVPGLGTAALVAAATPVLPVPLRLVVTAAVAAAVVTGIRATVPGLLATGLVGLVVAVGTGPAATAGPLGLLLWAAPTWVVVLVGADVVGPGRPRPQDRGTRLWTAAGAVGACATAAPLALLLRTGGLPSGGWTVLAGVALAALLVLATTAPRGDDDGPRGGRGARGVGGGWGI